MYANIFFVLCIFYKTHMVRLSTLKLITQWWQTNLASICIFSFSCQSKWYIFVWLQPRACVLFSYARRQPAAQNVNKHYLRKIMLFFTKPAWHREILICFSNFIVFQPKSLASAWFSQLYSTEYHYCQHRLHEAMQFKFCLYTCTCRWIKFLKKLWPCEQYLMQIRALHSYDKMGQNHPQNQPIRE